jgi:hypothetical protein
MFSQWNVREKERGLTGAHWKEGGHTYPRLLPTASCATHTAQRFSPSGVMLRLKLCRVEGDHTLSYWSSGILLAT